MARRSNCIYKITVNGWNERRPKHKKSFKSTMITNDFCDDSKLRTVPVSVRWMYLAILLTCGNEAREVVEIAESRLREVLESSKSVSRALDDLQSLRILSYEKISPFRREENRKEEKRIEKKEDNKLDGEKTAASPSVRADKSDSRGAIPEFCNDLVCFNLLKDSTHSAQKAWLAAYPNPEWVGMEIRKAHAWIESNKHKAPKNFQRFMANWLSRAYEDYRKGLSSKHKTTSQRNADSLMDMYQRVEKGEL